MSDFNPLQPSDFDRLSDEQLIGHAVSAREAGDSNQARAAIGQLVGGRIALVRSWVVKSVPAGEVDDVVAEVFASVMRAAFDGRSMGEFINLLKTITARRIADHTRDAKKRPKTTPLPDGDNEVWTEEPSAPSEEGAVELEDLVERELSKLSEDHRRVVESKLEGHSSQEVAGGTPGMTAVNVDQITSRFRKALREALENTEGGKMEQ